MAVITPPSDRPLPIPPSVNIETTPLVNLDGMFNPDELAQVIMTPDQLLDSACSARAVERVNKNRVRKGSSLAADIREATDKIRYYTDCSTIKAEIKKQLNTFADSNKSTIDEVKKKIKEIMPLLKVPTSPFKLPKYVKKTTIGRIMPDLEATLDFMKRAIEVAQAVSELSQAIQEVEPRLKACQYQIKDDINRLKEGAIDRAVAEVQFQIRDSIRETICGSLNALGIDQNMIDDIVDIAVAVSDIEDAVDDALGSVSGTVRQYQGDLQDLTGVPPVIDSSSKDAFKQSVVEATTVNPVTGTSPYQQYRQDVLAVFEQTDPVNTTAPSVTGTAEIGSTLTASTGTWQNSSTQALEYTYQWYRGDSAIVDATANTYKLTIDDYDKEIYCVVGAGLQTAGEEAKSNVVGPVRLPASVVPTVTGTATVGSTLTVAAASTSESWYTRNAPYRTYTWLRVNPSTNKIKIIEQDKQANAAPFSATYTITSDDVGSKIVASEFIAYGLGGITIDSAPTNTVT